MKALRSRRPGAARRSRWRCPRTRPCKVLATTADWGALADRARRRQGRRLHRDDGDAGRASRRGEAEPRRPRTHGGPAGRERRRTRDRLAAGAAAGIRQPADPARRARVTSRRRPPCTLVEVPTKLDRAMGDIHPLGNPHIQLDPRNVAAGCEGARPRGSQRSIRRTRRSTQRAAPISQRRWSEAIARWEAKAAPLKGRAGRRHAPRPGVSPPLARTQGSRRDRAEAGRAAERGLSRRARVASSPRRRRR